MSTGHRPGTTQLFVREFMEVPPETLPVPGGRWPAGCPNCRSGRGPTARGHGRGGHLEVSRYPRESSSRDDGDMGIDKWDVLRTAEPLLRDTFSALGVERVEYVVSFVEPYEVSVWLGTATDEKQRVHVSGRLGPFDQATSSVLRIGSASMTPGRCSDEFPHEADRIGGPTRRRGPRSEFGRCPSADRPEPARRLGRGPRLRRPADAPATGTWIPDGA